VGLAYLKTDSLQSYSTVGRTENLWTGGLQKPRHLSSLLLLSQLAVFHQIHHQAVHHISYVKWWQIPLELSVFLNSDDWRNTLLSYCCLHQTVRPGGARYTATSRKLPSSNMEITSFTLYLDFLNAMKCHSQMLQITYDKLQHCLCLLQLEILWDINSHYLHLDNDEVTAWRLINKNVVSDVQ